MKKLYAVTLLLLLLACSSKKKTPALKTPDPSTAAAPAPPPPLPVFRPENGVYQPGETELAEIRKKDSTVSMSKLQEGYYIYAQGECVRCHQPPNIYRPSDAQWPGLLSDMAMRARISSAQQDAVYKYILSVRAVKNAGK